MPLPSDPAQRSRLFKEIAAGDLDACQYLELISLLVGLADNMVDEDLPFATKQAFMLQILDVTLVRLPLNPFYARHAHHMAPLVASVLVAWQQSDDWKMSGDLKQKIFGFVRRENIDGLVVAVAAIVGGIEHARRAADRLYEVCHTTGETLEDWISEGRP